MGDELQHFGIPGMRWGRRKSRQTSSGGSTSAKGKQAVDDFVGKNGSKKAKDVVNESFGDKLARAYSLKKDSKGQYQITLSSIPKIFVTALAADYAAVSAAKFIQTGMNVYTAPTWVKFLAWNTGKVVGSSPIR